MPEFITGAVAMLAVIGILAAGFLIVWRPVDRAAQVRAEAQSAQRRRYIVCLGCDQMMEHKPNRFVCPGCWTRLPNPLRHRLAEAWASDRSGETKGALGAALDQARAEIQAQLPAHLRAGSS